MPARTWLTTTATLLVALILGTVILAIKPDQQEFQQPFVRFGQVGVPASARTFRITVLDVTGARKLQSGSTLETSGLWVAVGVRAVAVEEPTLIGYAALRDERGRTFLYSDRFTQPLAGGRPLQPGVPVEAQVFFEVPKDVKELTVRFAHPVSYGLDMDAVVEVPLPVTPTQIQAWAANETPLKPLKPKVPTA